MAVKSRRRRPAKPAAPTSGTTFHVLDQEGHELIPAQAHPTIALLRAQSIAERWGADGDESTLYVERHTLFGEPVELYRVVRTDDGVVRSYTTNRED